MTESYKIARLIYQAFVAPRPEPQDVAEFADALEIFADARGREKFVEDLLRESRKKPRHSSRPATATPARSNIRSRSPCWILTRRRNQNRTTHTHTHSRGQ